VVAVYTGEFGPEQARRLLNRAGFGPRPGEEVALAALGLDAAVKSLTRPQGRAKLTGKAPVDQDGLAIAPADVVGHDHLWWLDRMVRSDQPMVERMALIFHDWFATSRNGVSLQRHMLDQSNLFRANCFGSFLTLFTRVTIDPAMLSFLNGNRNYVGKPNENYAREMMELFSLGAKRGYTEGDIRQMARALTGWTNSSSPERGAYDFRFIPRRHDYGVKRIFGRRGRWSWRDAPKLCVQNRYHASFFVDKLWSYFIDSPPDAETRNELIRIYRGGRWRIRPVLEAILRHPDFYETGPMVKPPTVYLASIMRARGLTIDTDAWVGLCSAAGQQLFLPPNVSGWDDTAWLDTARMRARWEMVVRAIRPAAVALENPYAEVETEEAAVDRALAGWGGPPIGSEDRAELVNFASRSAAHAENATQRARYNRLRQEGLMQLIGVGPGMVLQ
jgi:uncharacterized protein (DUF1800 family)